MKICISWAVSVACLSGLCCSAATTAERPDTTGGGGGDGAGGGLPAAGGEGGGGDFPCGTDCSLIAAPQCLMAVCDEAERRCTLVPAGGGGACDDKDACTVGETCSDGVCRGGAPNDCGLTPGACEEVSCVAVDGAPRCATRPRGDGSSCATEDLCVINATCHDGVCSGVDRDCFFFPVSDSCHVGECNPATGLCEAVPGHEGTLCSDSGDLCMIGKTCQGGRCEGGAPTDCSELDVGCSNGACDPGSGNCYAEPIAPGGACVSGTNECNRGVCDEGGACVPIPTPGASCASQTAGCTAGVCSEAGVCTARSVPDGGACVDSDWCTLGETCLAGLCQGGRPASRATVYLSETFAGGAGGWDLGPTWQIGPARASSGQTYGNPDPALDHSPTADNGLAGVSIGGNAPLDVHPYYYLTSPVVDTDVPGGVYLTFWRLLNSDESPQMVNRVEVFDGVRWNVLFESGGYPGVRDAIWTKIRYDLTRFKNASLRVRFGYTIARDSFVDLISSWNVDDVEISNAACP